MIIDNALIEKVGVMKKKTVFLVIICLLTICGCHKDDITVTTGIIGTVEYGQGSCFPPIDPTSQKFSGYTGRIFFIVKEKLDNLGDGDYVQLKISSINVKVKNGNLSTNLPAGTYLVQPEDVYEYSTENTIVIKPNEVTHKDFKFFTCTSY
jgi:hypothetical protein